MPSLELKSLCTFLAIKRCKGTKIGKVIKQSQSSMYKLSCTVISGCLLPTVRVRSTLMSFGCVLRVICTIFLGQWSVFHQFFRSCFSCGHPRYKAIIKQFASKQKDISVTTLGSLVSDDAKYMDDLAFFSANGKPCLVRIIY